MKQSAFKLFLKQKRFDLIFKYLYLKYPGNNFVKKAYLENIRAFNNFHEIEPSDGITKDSPTAFLNSFDNLFQSIQKDDFCSWGKIPVGYNGEITDGAHRLSICAYLNKEIETEQDKYNNDLYDYNFFIQRNMQNDIMDYGALEYVKLNPNAYIVNLHSVTNMSKDSKVIQILDKYGFVYYKKDVQLTYNGYVNLKKISYGSFWEKENWIGTTENKFAGAQMHAKKSMGTNPMRVFVFVCDSVEKVKQAKTEIRSLYNIGNYSVHVNDCREEAIWLAEMYFNKNSLAMINSRPFDYEDPQFDKMLDELKQTAVEHAVPLEEICGAGSTPFDIYGFRKSNDLDFLYSGTKSFNIQTQTLSNHDSELKYYPYSKKDIIENPAYHFYYQGVKFITLDVLYQMKRNRNEVPKDVRDCKIIESFKKKKKYRNLNFKIFEKQKSENKRKIILFGFIKISYTKRSVPCQKNSK